MTAYVFDNNEGAGDGDMDVAANWLPEGIPGPGDTAQNLSETVTGGTLTCEAFANDGTVQGGTFNCPVTSSSIMDENSGPLVCNETVLNTGTIGAGTFNGDVTNDGGTIMVGDFHAGVQNDGTISGGTFHQTSNVDSTVWISGGTFVCSQGVGNQGGTVEDGTFNCDMYNEMGDLDGGQYNGDVTCLGGAINGGEFAAGKTVTSDDQINGGTFNGLVTDGGSVGFATWGGTFAGRVELRGAGALYEGTFTGTVDTIP